MNRNNPFEDSIFAPDTLYQSGKRISLYPTELELIRGQIIRANESTYQRSKILMVSSPDSGQGKSHLIAEAMTSQSAISIPVQINLTANSQCNYGSVLYQILSFLSNSSPEKPFSSLSAITRSLFTDLICNLVTDEIVPVQNKSTAIDGLNKHYDKMLNLKDNSSLVANWFKNNITALFPHLVTALSDKTGLPNESCEFWIEILYGCELDDPELIKKEILLLNEDDARSRIAEFNRCIMRDQSLILIFDHLDLLYNNKEQSLKVTQLLTDIAQQSVVPLVILSINDDLWNSTFANAIPSAIRDRINERNIRLSGISIRSAENLIKYRMECAGIDTRTTHNFIGSLELEKLYQRSPKDGLPSPRQVLRLASSEWLKNLTDKVLLDEPVTKTRTEFSQHENSSETLERIQKMMRSVNQRNASGQSKATETLAESPWNEPDTNAPSSVKDFADQRNELYSSGQSLFDTEAIRYTLEMAGKRSPIIEYREFDVHGDSSASSWLSPEMEIIFGFEPADRIPYWRALVDQAENSPMQNSKVIAFKSPDEEKFQFDALNGTAKENLDVLELDREELASIAAGKSIINASDSEEETFSEIAPELEFLWRRITRPVRNVSLKN
jgi:hypothetical protein